MKRIRLAAMLMLCLCLLTACGCKHEWAAASCTAPKTCTLCGETEWAALGHNWADATCEAPKTCTSCRATEGRALEHNWEAATCEMPKSCSTCGKEVGHPLEHSWQAATCETPKTCTGCGITEGEATDHVYGEWIAQHNNTMAKICTGCGNSETLPLNRGTMINDMLEGTTWQSYLISDGTSNTSYTSSFISFSPGHIFYMSTGKGVSYSGTWSFEEYITDDGSEFYSIMLTDLESDKTQRLFKFDKINGASSSDLVAYAGSSIIFYQKEF